MLTLSSFVPERDEFHCPLDIVPWRSVVMKNEEQSDEEHARELEIASVEESGNGQIYLLRGERGHDF